MNNVFEEGFLGAGINLAARLQGQPDTFLTDYPLIIPGNQRIAFKYSGTGAFVVLPFFVPHPGASFPYGAPVEDPD